MRYHLQRNSLAAKARYVVELTYSSQARWFNAKVPRYRGLPKAILAQAIWRCPFT